MKVVILYALLSVAVARMAYELPDGFLDILGGVPSLTFSCENRPYGYYADVANDCKIFHVCYSPVDELTGEISRKDHFSFICGNGTLFNQKSLTCSYPEDAYPCAQAETLYESSNADFGIIPALNVII